MRIAIQVEVEDAARTQYIVQAARTDKSKPQPGQEGMFVPTRWCDGPRGNVFEGSWADKWKQHEQLCMNPTGVIEHGIFHDHMAVFLASVVPQRV